MATHRVDEETVTQLLDAMAIMCDRESRPGALHEQIHQVSKILAPRLLANDGLLMSPIVEGVFDCGTQLSYKAPMYAVLFGLLLTHDDIEANQEMHQKILGNLQNLFSYHMEHSLRNGVLYRAKRLLRFLICLALANVFDMKSFLDRYIVVLLQAVQAELTLINESKRPPLHARISFFVDIILSVLPWMAYSDHLANHTEIHDLIDKICADYKRLSWRCIAPAILNRRCLDSFTELMDAVEELRGNSWIYKHDIIPNPYAVFKERLDKAPKSELADLKIPSHSKIIMYCPPRFRLVLVNERVTAAQAAEEKNSDATKDGDDEKAMDEEPDNSTDEKAKEEGEGDDKEEKDKEEEDKQVSTDKDKQYEKSKRTPILNLIIRSYINDVVDNFYTRHLMAAERLLTLPMLQDVNDEIVESLFSQMCSLPNPEFSPVYFGTLFADLCRVKDSRLPAKLLIAVQKMFEHADEFDSECFDRLTDWFSFHLSNFGYKWNWQEWSIYVDSDMVEQFPYRALFCKDVIAKCVRLSYYDRIKKFLPDDMKVFLPLLPNEGNYDRFNQPLNGELMRVVTGKGRLSSNEVKEHLARLIPDGQEPDDAAKSNLLRLASLIRAILQAGCRTLSHFDIVVERYRELLYDMSASGRQLAKKVITTEVNHFWYNVHIRRLYVLDKLAQYHIIDHLTIIDSCLETERMSIDLTFEAIEERDLKLHLANSNWWEIIRLTMQRLRAREDGSRAELTTAAKLAAHANEGEMEEIGRRLDRAKQSTEEVKTEIRTMISETLKKLFAITAHLLDTSADVDVSGTNMNNDGDSNDAAQNGEAAVVSGKDVVMDTSVKTAMADTDADKMEDANEDKEKTENEGDNENDATKSNGAMKTKDKDSGEEKKGSRSPIWYWRCAGMIREIARNHPQHLSHIVSDLGDKTKEAREKHTALQESFDIIEEIEKSSMNSVIR